MVLMLRLGNSEGKHHIVQNLDMYLINEGTAWYLSDAGGFDSWLDAHASNIVRAVQEAIPAGQKLVYVICESLSSLMHSIVQHSLSRHAALPSIHTSTIEPTTARSTGMHACMHLHVFCRRGQHSMYLWR